MLTEASKMPHLIFTEPSKNLHNAFTRVFRESSENLQISFTEPLRKSYRTSLAPYRPFPDSQRIFTVPSQSLHRTLADPSHNDHTALIKTEPPQVLTEVHHRPESFQSQESSQQSFFSLNPSGYTIGDPQPQGFTTLGLDLGLRTCNLANPSRGGASN